MVVTKSPYVFDNNVKLRCGEAMISFTTIAMPLIKSALKNIQLMKCGNMICLNVKKVKELRLHIFVISYRLFSFSFIYLCCVRYVFILLLKFMLLMPVFMRQLLHLMQYQEMLLLYSIEFVTQDECVQGMTL